MANFPEEVGTSTTATPAANHLLQVRNVKEVKLIHHTIAQLLFMNRRACRNIQTAVAFISMRVKSPDEDDGRKLNKVKKYLNGKKI